MNRAAAVLAAAAAALGSHRAAPDGAMPVSSQQQQQQQNLDTVPWRVGERLHYGVKFGFFNVGRATMEVLGVDTIRGEPCYHVSWVIDGGALGYSLHDSLQTWFGVRDLVSRRFIQDNDENGRMRYRHYEIFPERMKWIRNNTDSGATAPDPLDDASFFFFARTIPLEDKHTYTFNRYFIADRNPVTIKVIQHQTISVPAGRFRSIAVQPVFQSGGMFGQGGRAIIWFADDSTRVPLRVRAALPVGTLELALRSIE